MATTSGRFRYHFTSNLSIYLCVTCHLVVNLTIIKLSEISTEGGSVDTEHTAIGSKELEGESQGQERMEEAFE